jgi:hypothetical protein
MRRSFVGLCLVATMACAASAEAQPDRKRTEARDQGKGTKGNQAGDASAMTATGCLQRGSTPHSFVLQEPATDAGQAGRGITLVGSHTIDLSRYIGQTVQVSGVMAGRGGPDGHGAAAATRMTVREVRPLAGSCSAAQPDAGSVAGASAVTAPAASATTGTAPGSGATPPPDPTSTTTTTSGSSGQTGVSGNALLDGLINFNIQQLLVSIQLVANVQDTVINVTDVLNDFQIQALVQALNSNPVASLNATELSLALQQSGLLAPGETVVGVTPPTIRDNKTLTDSLQQQGILLPGERVVGAKGARVYKKKG